MAFGFGSGLAPRAPGTAGSLLGLVAAWWLVELPLVARFGLVAGVIALGIFVCGESARRLGRHDDQRIVFDEIAGVLLTAAIVAENTLVTLALAFVFFRFFDIVKPWPIRDVDHRLGGGLGIMLDDLIAALYAAACVATIRALLPTI
ncbi:MAG TPA: phosphatidylglycerophosphatase A [Gammaproteobacteria bacterium]|nr:phosphatidylglycerophosphatase A [Gammaproteobacteria bacterium]